MTTLTTSIRRAVRRASTPTDAHYHVDGSGRSYVCHGRRCHTPAVTLREARLTETGARRPLR